MINCKSLIGFIFIISFSTYSQDYYEKTCFLIPSQNEIVSIEIAIDNYSINAIGSLKDDLLKYDEKVIQALINEDETKLLFSYNKNMLIEDVIKAFEKHEVDYRREKINNLEYVGGKN